MLIIVMIFFYAKGKSLIIESCLVATETFVPMEIFSLTVNCCLPKTGKLSLSNERKSCPLSPCAFLKLFIRIVVFKCFSIDLQVIFPFHQMHYVVRALVRHTSTWICGSTLMTSELNARLSSFVPYSTSRIFLGETYLSFVPKTYD